MSQIPSIGAGVVDGAVEEGHLEADRHLHREYVRLRTLGAGRWGAVSVVRCRATGRDYAVKELHYSLQELGVQYLDELEAWTALAGTPCVIPCYFWRTADCRFPCIFLGYLPGRTLGAAIAAETFNTLPRIARAAVRLIDALTLIHERSVYHGDISPNNILVNRQRRLFLTDFGQARLSAGTQHHGGGTPAYFPSGHDPAELTPAIVDLHGYALVLVHLLAGHCFWQIGGLADLIIQRAPQHLRSRGRTGREWDVLLQFAQLVLNNPGARSARALGRELRAILSSHSIPCPPDPPVVPTQPKLGSLRTIGTIAYSAPQEWLSKAAHRFGTIDLPFNNAESVARFRRSEAVAAERTMLRLLPLYDQAQEIEGQLERVRLMKDIALARQASENYLDALNILWGMSAVCRRWQDHHPKMFQFRSWAILEIANIHAVLGLSRPSTCLYDAAIRHQQRACSQFGIRDRRAHIPHLLLQQTKALRYWQSTAEARHVCQHAIELLCSPDQQYESVDREEALADAYSVLGSLAPGKSAERRDFYRRSQASWQRLVEQGHPQYAEQAAIAEFQAIRAISVEKIEDTDITRLAALAHQFEAWVFEDQRSDLTVHLSRVWIVRSRWACRDETEDAADRYAQQAFELLRRAIRCGQTDLLPECALAADWLAKYRSIEQRQRSAVRYARYAHRIWEHLATSQHSVSAVANAARMAELLDQLYEAITTEIGPPATE